jgi:hypothetical protein
MDRDEGSALIVFRQPAKARSQMAIFLIPSQIAVFRLPICGALTPNLPKQMVSIC